MTIAGDTPRVESLSLRCGGLILLIIGTVVPILNIIVGFAVIVWWVIATYGNEDWSL